MREVSAGGIVLYKNNVLLLKKFNGTWVLPKGRVESGEELFQTALREVYEEGNVKADLSVYVDSIEYTYYNYVKNRKVNKTVHWFLMTSKNNACAPLKREGFVKASYINVNEAMTLLTHGNEQVVFKKALKLQKDDIR